VSKPDRRGAASPDCLAAHEIICWSRMQFESGEDLASIVRRKEIERRVGKGIFFWGVGNPPGLLPARLVRAGIEPAVVFSVMKTRPKPIDVTPTVVLAWRSYMDRHGHELPLPSHCLITSRGRAGTDAPTRHYALMCWSDTSLAVGDFGPFDPEVYRNLSGAGARIGASQVTALLRRVGPEGAGSYRVNLRAKLTQDLWVRLCDSVVLCGTRLAAMHDIGAQSSADEWLEFVSWVREGPPRTSRRQVYQPALL